MRKGLSRLVPLLLLVMTSCSSGDAQEPVAATGATGPCGSAEFTGGLSALKNYRENFDPLDSSQYTPISSKLRDLADVAESLGDSGKADTLRGVAEDVDTAKFLLDQALSDITDTSGLQEASDAAGVAADGLRSAEALCG